RDSAAGGPASNDRGLDRDCGFTSGGSYGAAQRPVYLGGRVYSRWLYRARGSECLTCDEGYFGSGFCCADGAEFRRTDSGSTFEFCTTDSESTFKLRTTDSGSTFEFRTADS